jgi:zinc transporter 1/2/3
MLAALGTLMVDVVGTEYYERKHAKEQFEDVIQPTDLLDGPATESAAEKDVHSENDQMHIVGIRAHAASHAHDMPSHHEHQHGSFQRSSSDGVSSHIRHMMVSQVNSFF